LPLVEPLDDGSAETHEFPAEAIAAGARARLHKVESFEACEQSVDRGSRLFEQLGKTPRSGLTLLGELLEEVNGLCQRADLVRTNLCLANLCLSRQLVCLLIRILDRLSA
jgi:hypothetical protein